jgi:hypothetical protein
MHANRSHVYKLMKITILCGVASFCIAGCSRDDARVSPNAATAAPARLPGENPHAYAAPMPKGMKK